MYEAHTQRSRHGNHGEGAINGKFTAEISRFARGYADQNDKAIAAGTVESLPT